MNKFSLIAYTHTQVKNPWYNYPVCIVSSALNTTIGGVLTLFLCMSLGGLLGCWIAYGQEMEGLDPLSAILCGFGSVVLASIQIWGVLYIFVMIYFLHRMLFEDLYMYRAALQFFVVHTLFSTFIYRMMDDMYGSDGAWLAVRFFGCAILGYGIYYSWNRFMPQWMRI